MYLIQYLSFFFFFLFENLFLKVEKLLFAAALITPLQKPKDPWVKFGGKNMGLVLSVCFID